MPSVISFHARVVPAKCRARVSTPDIQTAMADEANPVYCCPGPLSLCFHRTVTDHT